MEIEHGECCTQLSAVSACACALYVSLWHMLSGVCEVPSECRDFWYLHHSVEDDQCTLVETLTDQPALIRSNTAKKDYHMVWWHCKPIFYSFIHSFIHSFMVCSLKTFHNSQLRTLRTFCTSSQKDKRKVSQKCRQNRKTSKSAQGTNEDEICIKKTHTVKVLKLLTITKKEILLSFTTVCSFKSQPLSKLEAVTVAKGVATSFYALILVFGPRRCSSLSLDYCNSPNPGQTHYYSRTIKR